MRLDCTQSTSQDHPLNRSQMNEPISQLTRHSSVRRMLACLIANNFSDAQILAALQIIRAESPGIYPTTNKTTFGGWLSSIPARVQRFWKRSAL